jgi:hypothetical protein
LRARERKAFWCGSHKLKLLLFFENPKRKKRKKRAAGSDVNFHHFCTRA